MVSSTNGIKTWLWGTWVLTFVPWLCCNSPVWTFFSLLLFPENTASTLIINIFLYFITVSICWDCIVDYSSGNSKQKFHRNNWIPGVSLSNVIPISSAKQTICRGVFQDQNLHIVFQKKGMHLCQWCMHRVLKNGLTSEDLLVGIKATLFSFLDFQIVSLIWTIWYDSFCCSNILLEFLLKREREKFRLIENLKFESI